MASKATDPNKKVSSSDDGKSLGVLYTGYLDKQNPVSGSYCQRFVVLTNDSLHWFKRSEGYDLFGEERGNISLGDILATRILEDEPFTFEVQRTENNSSKLFRATSDHECEEWVTAIRSAIKMLTQQTTKRGIQRRASLAGIRNIMEEEQGFDSSEVTVLLMSLVSAMKQTEVVICRKPEWGRVILVPSVCKGDQILISLSNGGVVRLTYENILMRMGDEAKFEAPVQNVALMSSLQVTLCEEKVNLRGGSQSRQGEEGGGGGGGGKASSLNALVNSIVVLTSNRKTAINLVLSMMVLVVALSSLRSIGIDTTLLFMFACLLSVYNFNSIIQSAVGENSSSGARDGSVPLSLFMILHDHTFTSADAPAKEPEDTIPQRFIDGCDQDMKEARRRWDITRHWRETEGVNNVLSEPQPHFSTIKQLYPHFNSGRGKLGHIIFWERPGEFQGDQLAARGIKTEELVRHWIFCTEYQWTVLAGGDETAKSIAVLDVNGISMSDLAGSNMDYIKKTLGIANMHYPERSYVIYIINAPFYASMMWKLIKPLVHENTQRKVRILSAKESLKGLQEHIDMSQIPEFYGGGLDFGGKDSARFNCPEQLAMDEFVRKINAGEAAGGGAAATAAGGGGDAPEAGAAGAANNVPFSNGNSSVAAAGAGAGAGGMKSSTSSDAAAATVTPSRAAGAAGATGVAERRGGGGGGGAKNLLSPEANAPPGNAGDNPSQQAAAAHVTPVAGGKAYRRQSAMMNGAASAAAVGARSDSPTIDAISPLTIPTVTGTSPG